MFHSCTHCITLQNAHITRVSHHLARDKQKVNFSATNWSIPNIFPIWGQEQGAGPKSLAPRRTLDPPLKTLQSVRSKEGQLRSSAESGFRDVRLTGGHVSPLEPWTSGQQVLRRYKLRGITENGLPPLRQIDSDFGGRRTVLRRAATQQFEKQGRRQCRAWAWNVGFNSVLRLE